MGFADCQHHIKIKDTDIIGINVCDVVDPGFLFIKTTSEKAREICELTGMKRLFGPYLDPEAYGKFNFIILNIIIVGFPIFFI